MALEAQPHLGVGFTIEAKSNPRHFVKLHARHKRRGGVEDL